MISSETVITGMCEKEQSLKLPEFALNNFYRAFNTCDMDLMSQNWMNSYESSMSNPLGGLKRGWQSIKKVYENIFFGPSNVYVEFHDITIHEAQDMFIAVGRERGYFQLGENKIGLQIRTSRSFKLVAGLWQQIHHHGSIEDPELLRHYQNSVRTIKHDEQFSE